MRGNVTWHDGTNGTTWRKDKRKHRDVSRCLSVRVQRGCKTPLLDGPDCKMATRGIIVRTRDLPSVALSPSQRATEVAMATDKRKPAPTPSISPDASRRLRRLSLRQVILLHHSTASISALFPPLPLFFPLFPRTFPLCFFAVVARRLFSLALQILKRRREPLRSMIPSVVVLSATEFSMNKRTNNIRVRYRSPIYRVCFSHYIFESTYAIVVYIKIWNVFLCHAERRPNIFVMRTYLDRVFTVYTHLPDGKLLFYRRDSVENQIANLVNICHSLLWFLNIKICIYIMG